MISIQENAREYPTQINAVLENGIAKLRSKSMFVLDINLTYANNYFLLFPYIFGIC